MVLRAAFAGCDLIDDDDAIPRENDVVELYDDLVGVVTLDPQSAIERCDDIDLDGICE